MLISCYWFATCALQSKDREIGLGRIASRSCACRDPCLEQRVVGLHVEDRERHPQRLGQRGERIAPAAFEERRVDDGRVTGLDDRAGEIGEPSVGPLGQLGAVDGRLVVRGRDALGVATEQALALHVGAQADRAEPFDELPGDVALATARQAVGDQQARSARLAQALGQCQVVV